jgi:cytochrome c oxidase subunit II
MQQPTSGRREIASGTIIALALIVAVGILVVVGSLTVLQFDEPVTEQAERINRLYLVTLAISMVVYFGVTAAIIWAIFRYKRRGPELPAQIHGSSAFEIGWTAVPVLILVGLFIPSLILLIDLKTPPEPGAADLEIEAIGHQWWWEFSYPDAGVRVQTTPPNYDDLVPPVMVVPVGQTVRVIVRSVDVIHSFYAPQFLYKIQAIPGNLNELHFTVTKPGRYYGQCYQFCGLRHSDMIFYIEAVEPADFQRWLNQQRALQGLATEDELAKTSGGD